MAQCFHTVEGVQRQLSEWRYGRIAGVRTDHPVTANTSADSTSPAIGRVISP
jgi:hypothetical protein